MNEISSIMRADVVFRAGNRCEYCRLSQLGQEAVFHIDHVTPRAADGPTILENLALACVSCSLRKGARQGAIDPDSGHETPFYNPRTQVWREHFGWEREVVVPLTPIGRVTVSALAMNRPVIVAIRREETARGRHPPP
jgi:hypothetical protein